MYAAVDIWFAELHAHVTDKESCGEIVASVHYHIISSYDIRGVLRGEKTVIYVDMYLGIECVESFESAFHLAAAYVGFPVKGLALKIGQAHLVGICDSEGAYSGCSKVCGDGGAQSACSYQQNPG